MLAAMARARRIVVGISGASGALYAQRTLMALLEAGVEAHLVVTALGQRLLRDELDDPDLSALAAGRPGKLVVHRPGDVGATIASGSFLHEGMVVVPCSSNSLSAVATGQAQHLLHRAAAVCLKERRPLVLVHRETPLSRTDLRNMLAADEAGALVLPANPAFYHRPGTLEQLADTVVARVLDHLQVDHRLPVRWTGQAPHPAGGHLAGAGGGP